MATRCPPPCGKARYASEHAAKRAWIHHHNRMRAYWSAGCKCWHTTKEVMTDEAKCQKFTTRAHRRRDSR